MNKPIILVFVPILIAGCTFFLNTEEKRSQMEKVKINVDIIKSLGELPRDVAGIMTDPPRPQWLQDHLLSTGLFGDNVISTENINDKNSYTLSEDISALLVKKLDNKEFGTCSVI